MKEGVFVINYFAHCVDVEELYENMVSPVCEKYELTYMEFTVLMFLANNPQYDTATQIVRYRHLAKSHVSVSIRSLQERGLVLGEHREGNHRTIHLSVADKARDIIADGRVAQGKFCEIVFAGFSKEEIEQVENKIFDLAFELELESGIVINPVLENEEHYKYWLGALPFFDNVEKEGIVIG